MLKEENTFNLRTSDDRSARAEFRHSNFELVSDFGFRISSFPRGFSLTEVMFAVIVLGIGFILIAAIFPVSIAQSRLTIEETTAAASARSALAFTSKIAEGGDALTINGGFGLLPTTDLYLSPPATAVGLSGTVVTVNPGQQVRLGKVLSFNDPRLVTQDPLDPPIGPGSIDFRNNLWNAVKGSIVLPSDNRYAWVPFYRRDMIYYNPEPPPPIGQSYDVPAQQLIASPSPYAQVYFIPVAVRNRSTYDASVVGPDLFATGAGVNRVQPNLAPKLVLMQIREIFAGSGEFFAIFDATVPASQSVVEGCFVIISDDKIISPAADIGIMNGRSYRIGNRRIDLDTAPGVTNGEVWELAPGGDFKSDPGANGIPNDADDVTAIGAPGASPSLVTVSEPATAFIIGRNAIAPGVFEGVAQDIGVYVTFVKVN